MCMDEWMDGRVNTCMYVCMAGWTDECMCGWVGGCMSVCMD